MREVHRRLVPAALLVALLLAMTVHYGAVDARTIAGPSAHGR